MLTNKSLKLPCGAILPNRFAKAAMSERLADDLGNPTVELETLYRRWSNGGAGLLLSGHVLFRYDAFEATGNVIIEKLADKAAFRRWSKAGTANGNHFWMQINHTGRQTFQYISKTPVAPSDSPRVKAAPIFKKARALSESEIESLIDQWALAGKFAKETGFTGVQIHSAHGYLGSQFLSPLTNRRTDQWGGSIENRSRFLLQIIRKTRKHVGAKFPISVKINSADFQRGGFSEEDSLKVVRLLSNEGIDLLEISGGTYESLAFVGTQEKEKKKESTIKREAFFLDYAAKARKISTVPLMVTGGFRTLEGMERALQKNATDIIGLARPLALAPEIINELLHNEKKGINTNPVKPFPFSSYRHMAELIWDMDQIRRISLGLEPDPARSILLSFFADFFRSLRSARRQMKKFHSEGLR